MRTLPAARGPITEYLLDELRHDAHVLRRMHMPEVSDPLSDEDLQLGLYLCYELHYRGLPEVDERWEWEPSLLALRGMLERRFERALEDEVPLGQRSVPADDVDLALRAVAERDGPSDRLEGRWEIAN